MTIERNELETFEPDVMGFRRRTELRKGDVSVIVSTIGRFKTPPVLAKYTDNDYMEIGAYRFYETMVWFSKSGDCDIDRGEIRFESPWSINYINDTSDDDAIAMHETVVAEITLKMQQGERFDHVS